MSIAWTIAGADPSGAAGIQADQRTFAALGVHVCSVLTAVTAQSFGVFEAVMPLPPADVEAQLRVLTQGRMPVPAAVKIGMLATADVVRVVAAALMAHKAFVVLDPVLAASTGGALASDDMVPALCEHLLPRVDLLTPNIPEAARLSGLSIGSYSEVPRAAAALLGRGAKRVLVKGGHLPGELVHDYFASAEASYWLTSTRQQAVVRGTGCALAAALAAFIALGRPVDDALVLARSYIGRGIRTALPTAAGPSLLGWMETLATSADVPWRTPSLAAATSRPKFPSCGPSPLGFYPIVDRAAWVRRLVELGVTTIQLRIKDLQGEALQREVAAGVAIGQRPGVRLFINDHWALALELGAYGVHLGQEDLLTADLTALATAGLRLGISSHCHSEAAVAHGIRPSYLALGPIFPTSCKSLRFGPHGFQRIVEWRRLFPYPLVAIGGLKYEHADIAMRLGADGVAAISDVVHAADPERQVRLWQQRCRREDA